MSDAVPATLLLIAFVAAALGFLLWSTGRRLRKPVGTAGRSSASSSSDHNSDPSPAVGAAFLTASTPSDCGSSGSDGGGSSGGCD